MGDHEQVLSVLSATMDFCRWTVMEALSIMKNQYVRQGARRAPDREGKGGYAQSIAKARQTASDADSRPLPLPQYHER